MEKAILGKRMALRRRIKGRKCSDSPQEQVTFRKKVSAGAEGRLGGHNVDTGRRRWKNGVCGDPTFQQIYHLGKCKKKGGKGCKNRASEGKQTNCITSPQLLKKTVSLT